MSYPIPKSKRNLSIDDNGIIKKDFVWDGGWTEIYSATVDLRGFVKEFANHLANNKDLPFTDVLGADGKGKFFEHYASGSEFAKTGAHLTRSKNMFEKKFVISKFARGYDVELQWEAKAKSKFSNFGWIYFKLDLQVRNIQDVEVVVDGNKKIMQKGNWEFRNILTYYNKVIPDYLHSIPLVRDSAEAQRLILDHMYISNIERDFDFVKLKIKPLIWNVLYKHFR